MKIRSIGNPVPGTWWYDWTAEKVRQTNCSW